MLVSGEFAHFCLLGGKGVTWSISRSGHTHLGVGGKFAQQALSCSFHTFRISVKDGTMLSMRSLGLVLSNVSGSQDTWSPWETALIPDYPGQKILPYLTPLI